MKLPLLVAILGLAISFALPTYAQQTNTPDPKLRERFISRFKVFTDALHKGDAAAAAANFTKDAVLVTPYGPVFGRSAIQGWYVDLLKVVQLSIDFSPVDEDSPHVLCTAGNALWATGKCSGTGKGQNGSVLGKGYWSAIDIREGDDWKFQMLCYTITFAPAATAAPTASPTGH